MPTWLKSAAFHKILCDTSKHTNNYYYNPLTRKFNCPNTIVIIITSAVFTLTKNWGDSDNDPAEMERRLLPSGVPITN